MRYIRRAATAALAAVVLLCSGCFDMFEGYAPDGYTPVATTTRTTATSALRTTATAPTVRVWPTGRGTTRTRYTTARYTTKKPPVTTATTRRTVTTAAPQTNLFAGYTLPTHRTMYGKLTQGEQYIYRQLRACVINDTYVCVLEQVNYDAYIAMLDRAAFALYADFPEFFWISHTTFYKKLSAGNVGDLQVSLYCNAYWNTVTNRRQMVVSVMQEAQALAANVKSTYSTAFERLRYLHDYLTTNITYDHETAAIIGSPQQTAAQQQAYSAYGALIRGSAVCEGYAKAYKLVANLCGYTCEYVEGLGDGGRHAWNYITVDGKHYWVDTTWDDPDAALTAAARWYTYFGITTERLSRTHVPSTLYFTPPVCNDTAYDFYHRTGSHLTQYSFNAVQTAAAPQVRYGRCVNLRFSTEAALQAAVNDLFGANARHRQLNLGGRQVARYFVNKTHNTLLLILE